MWDLRGTALSLEVPYWMVEALPSLHPGSASPSAQACSLSFPSQASIPNRHFARLPLSILFWDTQAGTLYFLLVLPCLISNN